MGDAYITLDIGKGLYGGSCIGTPPENPVIIFGAPFGHGFLNNLNWLLENCNNCSIYLPTTTFDVNSLSSQHEVINTYCRAYGGTELNDGDECELHTIWRKDTTTIYYDILYFYWDENYDYFHEVVFIGWTPCWCWKYGSFYNGWEEINDEGSDYSVTVEFYGDGYFLDYETIGFTVANLHHTTAYWNHIQNYIDNEISGPFGMEASSYVHDLGDDVYTTAYYKQQNLTNDDIIYIDGMEGTVDLKVFHSGYVKQIRSRDDVVDKDINGPFDFTGSENYLRASVEGIVKDEDGNPVENVAVFGTSYNPAQRYYGGKTNADGKYALPFHKAGHYYIHALKNNFYSKDHSHDSIYQGSDHPETKTTIDFIGSNCINRIKDYPIGTHAHSNTLAVDNQSVIIPDDPVTSDGSLPLPENVAGTIVKAKTVTWGTAPTQSTTSTGTWDSSTGYGSGGFDYDGDMGDAEDWEEE